MKYHRTAHRVLAALLTLACLRAAPLLAQSAEISTSNEELAAGTVIIFDPSFPGAEKLARHYAEQRHISAEHLIPLRAAHPEIISRAEYVRDIREPLRRLFFSRGWWLADAPVSASKLRSSTSTSLTANVIQSRIHTLAIIRGLPWQIRRDQPNPSTAKEDEASLDSELTLLSMPSHPAEGGMKNPYFKQSTPFTRFTRAPGLLLTARLDGPDDATVRRIIADSLHAETHGLHGRAVIDLARKTGSYQEGEDWLQAAATHCQQAGIPVFIERSEALLREHWPLPDTILYLGWYAQDVSGVFTSPSFQFPRGAIACHLHSYSAAVLRDPTRSWAGPLLAKGAAATFGNVFERFLSLTVHFDHLTERLLSGATLAEAAWSATPALSWMNVVIGDPLYRPFARATSASLGDEAQRSYLLYRGIASRARIEGDAEIKKALTTLADKRRSPQLLELTALLSMLQGKHAEALDLLDHAEALTTDLAHLLRLRLYRADCLHRDDKPKTAAQLLQTLQLDARYHSLDGYPAVQTLLNALQK
jgi:uncharacterized protein (TIGR03790 family)